MKTVLIIEDTDFISENIAITLGFEGYNAVVACDGVDGLKKLEEYKPDLVLCDVSMPRLDGFGVLAEIKKRPEFQTIPFIFLTAKAEKSDMRRGMELGADDYLTKPFTTEELVAAVTTQLTKKEKVVSHYEEKLDELRGTISYSLPHEFRTALNGILGYSDIILQMANAASSDTPVDPAELKEVAEAIRESGKRLSRMTENYLAYTQIRAVLDVPAKVAEFRSQITISTLDTIQDVVMALSPIFSRETDVRLDIEDATVQIGPQNLYKLCSELIDNALKFSNKGDAVTVKGSAEAGTYKIEVVDSGRGMTTEQIESIGAYQQFGRREFEQQGAGLGLAIAKLLVLLHGGEFTVSSETGNGTVVKVTLPIAQEIDF